MTATIELPIINDYGITVMEDFLNEVLRRYEVEKNIKNNLYAFISKQGLFDEWVEYNRLVDMKATGGYQISKKVKQKKRTCA